MFVIGAVRGPVASVRVALGAGRWVDATILSPLTSELRFPFRLFLIDEKTGQQSLNRRRSIVAFDDRGREIGRTSYLVLGG
jgi:hypothetical protein